MFFSDLIGRIKINVPFNMQIKVRRGFKNSGPIIATKNIMRQIEASLCCFSEFEINYFERKRIIYYSRHKREHLVVGAIQGHRDGSIFPSPCHLQNEKYLPRKNLLSYLLAEYLPM